MLLKYKDFFAMSFFAHLPKNVFSLMLSYLTSVFASLETTKKVSLGQS